MHQMAAVAFKNELFALDKTEANVLATAVLDVSRHYEVLDGVSDKVVSWIGLANALGMVYGPRIVAARLSSKAKPNASEEQTATVKSFPQGLAA